MINDSVKVIEGFHLEGHIRKWLFMHCVRLTTHIECHKSLINKMKIICRLRVCFLLLTLSLSLSLPVLGVTVCLYMAFHCSSHESWKHSLSFCKTYLIIFRVPLKHLRIPEALVSLYACVCAYTTNVYIYFCAIILSFSLVGIKHYLFPRI